VVLVAVLAGAACGPNLPGPMPPTPAPEQFAIKPGQEQAVRLVWNGTYGRSDRAPAVRWIEGDKLTCTDPNSEKPGFPTPSGCREGMTALPMEVSVAWTGQATFSGTTLAHELLHALQFRTGIIDPNHRTEGFRPLAECATPVEGLCGIVDRANETLAGQQL
jgi:hypothetical protein